MKCFIDKKEVITEVGRIWSKVGSTKPQNEEFLNMPLIHTHTHGLKKERKTEMCIDFLKDILK